MNHDKLIRESWFSHHIAKMGTPVVTPENAAMSVLYWGRAGSMFHFCRYLLFSGTLIVNGDIGDAVYGFDREWTLADISRCNMNYFMKKLLCSSEVLGAGKIGRSWSPEKAAKDVLRHEAREEHVATKQKVTLFWQMIRQGRFSDYEEFQSYLRDEGEQIFSDQDFWEYAGEFGVDYDVRHYGHLIGLRMAIKQLGLDKDDALND